MPTQRRDASQGEQGRTGGRRSGRRATLRWLVVALVAVAAWAAWAGAELYRGFVLAKRGQAELASAGLGTVGQAIPSTVSTSLATASATFAAADRSLHGPALLPVSVMPVLGRQLASARALTAGAGTVAAAGVAAVSSAKAALDLPKGTAEGRLAILERLGASASRLQASLDGVHLGPSDALLGPLARARGTMSNDLNRLRGDVARASGAIRGAVTLLSGSHRILFIGANNSEMRNGSGSFLAAGSAVTGSGAVSFGSFAPAYVLALARPGAPLPPVIEARWGWMQPGRYLDALGASPDFALNAPVAASIWSRTGRHNAGTVAVVDPVALADLLSVTGPVTFQGQSVSSSNVVPLLVSQQYQAGATGSTAVSEERLGALASAVLARAYSAPVNPVDLVRALSDAAAGRHLMLWSRSSALEADWRQAGVSGVPSRTDVSVGLVNLAANKIDPLTQVTVGVSHAESGPDTLLRLKIRVHDTASAVPSLVDGPAPGLGTTAGQYLGMLAVDLPQGLLHASVASHPQVVAAGPDGASYVIAPLVRIPPGGTAVYSISWVMAGHHGTLTVAPSARVPPETWAYAGDKFSDARPHSISW